MMKRMVRATKAIAIAVMTLATAAAQQNVQQASAADQAATALTKPGTASGKLVQDRHPRYTVQAGDSFDISFELSPEFNQAVTVQPDGFVTLRGVGDVYVSGQTVPQVTQTLRTSYEKILHDPIVSVLLKDFEKPYFTVDGQVGRPGKYDLRGDTTVTQALAVAGGLSASAKHSQVLLFRHVSDEWVEARVLNVKKMMKSGNLNEDMYLHPGDMVYVPKNAFSKIDRFLPTTNLGTFLHY